MTSRPTAAVLGASGYAGAEVLRLLLGHPEFVIGPIAGSPTRVGTPVRADLPHLVGLGDRTFDAPDDPAIAGTDVVFLALPHGASADVVAGLPEGQRVVDLGADFRLKSATAWQHYYGGTHAGTWTYGLPELPGTRDIVRTSSRVANPGCYATAIQLALAPLLAGHLVSADDIVIVAASGTSGAGRKATDALLASNVMGSMSAYKVGGIHQHTPEIEEQLTLHAGEPVQLSFTPLLAPMSRGIVATCTAKLAGSASANAIVTSLNEAYAYEEFVHVLEPGRWPQTSSVYASNACHLQVAVDEHAGRVVVVSAIDNLGKGAAGQAIQNANLLFGFSEGAGLTSEGVAP